MTTAAHAHGPQNGKRGSLAVWTDFEHELREREQSIASMLPSHVSKERFINSAIAAVKQNPELLMASPRSLFASVTKSAQDGLLPDGREGVITTYNQKIKERGKPDRWEITAQWNPMAWGLRKRAREIDEIIVNAQVVHANDRFVWSEGDEPHIEHEPAPLGTERGALIGAYAIFKQGSDILHREVMSAQQIEAVRSQSKASDSLMWTKFASEGYRKTVLRRGFKSVPCSEKLETILHRDDDLFDFSGDAASIGSAPAPERIAAPARNGNGAAAPRTIAAPATAAAKTQTVAAPQRESEVVDGETLPPGFDLEKFMGQCREAFGNARTPEEVNDIWNHEIEVVIEELPMTHQGDLHAMMGEAEERVAGAQ